MPLHCLPLTTSLFLLHPGNGLDPVRSSKHAGRKQVTTIPPKTVWQSYEKHDPLQSKSSAVTSEEMLSQRSNISNTFSRSPFTEIQHLPHQAYPPGARIGFRFAKTTIPKKLATPYHFRRVLIRTVSVRYEPVRYYKYNTVFTVQYCFVL